jgi:hypothetical protein
VRNSSIQFQSSSGQGTIGINDTDGQFREAVLLENTTIAGYDRALAAGNFRAHQLVINNCGTAFESLQNLQLSESSIFVENLGEVQEVAILSDSKLRTSNVGLWAGKVDIRNCSFSNQDLRSSRGLEIRGHGSPIGGAIRNTSFSGFQTGVFATVGVGIHESTFSDCNLAIDIRAANSAITKNTITACQNGIEAGNDALIAENVVHSQGVAISGDGLIVKNMVMVGSGPAYNLGGGTVGRELTCNAINPNPDPNVEDAGEPWANVWQSY